MTPSCDVAVRNFRLTPPIAAAGSALTLSVIVIVAPGAIDLEYVPATTTPVMSVVPAVNFTLNPGDVPCPFRVMRSVVSPSFWILHENVTLPFLEIGTCEIVCPAPDAL